ncbi:MAG: cytochrome c family protein, partial [Planctomycetes bacterium]|nr:cytochrome c family protein [Planctomycetota bacterium]
MYRIALLYLALCLLAPLGRAPLSAEDPVAGKPAAETGTKWKKGDFQPAEACKTCHPRHYEEWRGSMHAYAITDPVFHAMHRLAQKETGGAIGDFCIGCHAPVGTGTGEVTASTRSPEGLSKTALAAVSCEACHRSVHL